jgi:hypothetical protein
LVGPVAGTIPPATTSVGLKAGEVARRVRGAAREEGSELAAVADAELLHRAIEVRLHRAHREDKAVRDLRVGEAAAAALRVAPPER